MYTHTESMNISTYVFIRVYSLTCEHTSLCIPLNAQKTCIHSHIEYIELNFIVQQSILVHTHNLTYVHLCVLIGAGYNEKK